MTYPPDPSSRPDPPPADPFLSPPSWEPYGGEQYGTTQPYGAGQAPGSGAPYGSPPPYEPSSPYGSPPPHGSSPYGSSPPHGSSPYGSPPPYGSGDQPGSSPPYQPGSSPPYGPGGGPPYGPAGPYLPPPPRSRRGLLITGIVLAAVLVLCTGGGLGAFLLTRDTDRDGAESPTAAVQSFLQAVYRDQDGSTAADMVCSEARDESVLTTKIDEIAAYDDVHAEPSFTWSSPQVVDQTEDLAIVATTVTMITADEKTSDLPLRVSVLDKGQHGWWVCDLETTAPESDPPADDSDESDESGDSGDAEDGEDGEDGGDSDG